MNRKKDKPKIVPVILQMENVECGSASLAMILAYYKKYIPLEQLRSVCNISRDGSSAKNIYQAATFYNLKTRAFSCDIEILQNKVKFPAIIHWNFNHFVVLCGFHKNDAVINDPAIGKAYIALDEFSKSFTGVVLEFTPNDSFAAEGAPKNVIKFLFKRLENSFVPLFFIFLLGILFATITIFMPLFSKIFTDYILFAKSSQWLMPLIVAMTVTLLLTFFIQAMQEHYLLKVRGKLSIISATMFFTHVLNLPMDFFKQRFTGDITERQQSNDEIAEIICTRITPVFLNVIMLGFYVVILFNYDVKIAIVGIIVGFINLIIVWYIGKENLNNSRTMMRDMGKLSGLTMSGIDMMETIKSSGAERGYFEKWAGYHAKVTNATRTMDLRNIYLGAIPRTLQGLLDIYVIIAGVYNILNGQFTVGALLSLQGFISAYLRPVNKLLDLGEAMQNVKGQMERVEDVMDYKTNDSSGLENHSQNDNVDEYKRLIGNVEFKNVTFGYSKIGEPLIKNFSLNILAGQTIALVGASGSGKSTLAKLITGIYEVRDGEILFDGKSKKQFDSNVFANSLSVVAQNTTIFSDSIENNITMWNNQIEKKDMIIACKDAQIYEEIEKRSGGYNDILLENGRNISGGQQQRIDIARALVTNPSIIILDEATSALDTVNEKNVMDAIKKRGITMIIIAHRLSTIRDADQIVFLENGEIVEQGTHLELIELNKKYARLVSIGQL